MRVENHRCTEYIPEDSSADDCAHIAVEVREEAYVDCEVDYEEDDEILYDAGISDFFEQKDIDDEGRYGDPIEDMIDCSEIAEMRDVSDDEDCDEDDIE
jgi:hypothetical protein